MSSQVVPQPSPASAPSSAPSSTPSTAKPFDEWMKENLTAAISKPDEILVEHPKLAPIAAGRAFSHLKAAIAMGLQCLPADKFKPEHAIELARFMYEIESDMNDELVTEEDEEPADPPNGPR